MLPTAAQDYRVRALSLAAEREETQLTMNGCPSSLILDTKEPSPFGILRECQDRRRRRYVLLLQMNVPGRNPMRANCVINSGDGRRPHFRGTLMLNINRFSATCIIKCQLRGNSWQQLNIFVTFLLYSAVYKQTPKI